MKKSILKIGIILILFVSSLSLSGCSNVKYYFDCTNKNAFREIVEIDLDVKKINNSMALLIDLKDAIYNTAINYFSIKQIEFKESVSKYITNVEKLSRDDINKIIDCVDIEYGFSVEYQNNFYVNIIYNRYKKDEDTILTSSDVYRLFHTNIKDEERLEFIKEEDLLTATYTANLSTVFSRETYNQIKQLFKNNFNYILYGFTEDDIDLFYNLIVSSSRLKSDADYTIISQGNYIHTWSLNDRARMITVYFTSAKSLTFRIIALTCGLLSLIVMLTIYFIKKRKNNKN